MSGLIIHDLKSINGLTATALNEASDAIFKNADHALIGISPFNGYFSVERMRKLFQWSFSTFKKVHIFIPDGISVHTLRGLGHADDYAARKTRENDKTLRKNVCKALSSFSHPQSNSCILYMSDLLKNEQYLTVYKEILKQFERNEDFRSMCLKFSEEILLSKNQTNKPLNPLIAVPYLLYELPFFLNTPYILGVDSSVTIYHSTPNLVTQLYGMGLMGNNTGFVQVTVA
jgi:cyclo(L-tyrosyl-L-tyrosyl) synthase